MPQTTRLGLLAIAGLIGIAAVQAAASSGGTTCNATSPCPASAPCCSEYGFCGSDTFCLGGCNPLSSHTLTSCRPNPVCQDATHTFTDSSRILSNSSYFDGNASEYDWVVDKGSVINASDSTDGALGLVLTESNGGTKISSTRYVHYGTISAKLKTGRWAGVVTAFITMSNIKDEIDWEFPGQNTTAGQTNFFWEGTIPDQTNGQTHTVQDTFSDWHEYTIDWQPTSLTFSIDGSTVRTVQASDAGGQYPTTPARVQLSLWPAGINSSAPGTVQWAGGMINWDDPDYKSAGHFYAMVKSVDIKCADPSSTMNPNGTSAGTGTGGITSYVYGANETDNGVQVPGVMFSNQSVLVNGAAAGHLGLLGVSRVTGLGMGVLWAVAGVVGAILLEVV